MELSTSTGTTDQQKGESDRVSKIVTLNIENFHTNKLYLKELMDTCEIICLQEHWLYNFEQSTLDDFCAENNFDSYIKSTDDSDPISPLQRPRGKGGVAILWRENIPKNIQKIPDGSNRICGVTCNTEKGPITIINVYIPCRGLKLSDDLFCETLDELREIIVKYSVSSHIILVGDLNASLHRDQPLTRDKKLQTLLEDTNLVLNDSYPDEFTYIHGKGMSVIDYIISSDKNILNNICVNTDNSLNTSPHYAVVADMIHIPTSKLEISCPKPNVKKVNWKKLDGEKYQSLLVERLPKVEKSKDINERVGQITDIVTSTALECAPVKKQKPKNCKKFWCPELARLSKDSKRAFGEWKKGGCPAEPHCNLVLAKNSAKKDLRRRQRQINAENR